MYAEQSYAYFNHKIKIFVLVSFHVLGPCMVDIPFVVRGCHFHHILFFPYLENLYKRRMSETFWAFQIHLLMCYPLQVNVAQTVDTVLTANSYHFLSAKFITVTLPTQPVAHMNSRVATAGSD
jgi:hypothetical protein